MKISLKVVILAAATALTPLMAMAETVKVGIGSDPFPPFTVPDADGNWSGWEIDFIHAICEVEKMDCVIVPIAWDGIIPALNAGTIDVIMSSMSRTAAREKVIDFSDKYWQLPVNLIGNKASDLKPTNESLSGKTIGAQVSTPPIDYIAKHYPDATLKTYPTMDDVFQDLASGRIDAMLSSWAAAKTFLASKDGQECCADMGAVPHDPELFGPGQAAGLRKGDTELKEKINHGIKTLRENGTYAKISAKYFDIDPYGQ